jgi:hypothetical protein
MKLWKSAARKLGAALLAMGLGCGLAVAQLNSGSLAGTVTDGTGGVIPGAQVVATELQSGSVYRTTTSSSGAYVFTSLRPGSYDVTASAPSFKLTRATGIPVYVTTRASHDFALSAGSTTDVVTVDANAPSLETETSDVGTVLTPEQVQDLPSQAGGAMRSLAALTLLTPGAVGTGTNGGTSFVKIGGGQTFGSDNLLDGLSTQRSENGTEYFDQMTPSLDAIEEFRVVTLAPPAYLGRTTGGLANFKTKGGTNTYHGTIYDYYKNTIFDANNYFNKGNALIQPVPVTQDSSRAFARPADMHQDYGLTLGGPLRIPHVYNGQDKTFFFFSYEQVPSSFGHTSYSTVPTLAERGLSNASGGTIGDFSAVLGSALPGVTNPCNNNAAVLAGQIFDPTTTRTVNGVECRTAFVNNQIPLGRSAVAAKVLALIPLPNYTGAGTSNYIFQYNEKVNQFDNSLRIDQNFGTRNHLFVFVNARENFDTGVADLPGPINTGSQQQDFFAKLIRVGYDFTITPHLINQVTVGGNRINSFNSAPAVFNGINYDSQLGIPNTPSSGNTFPLFNIADMSGLGSSNADDNVDNALMADDNVSWQKGQHSVRIGGSYRWTEFSYENNGPAAGYFNFSRTQTSGVNNATAESGSGYGIASFLLGAPANTGRSLQIHFPRWIQNYYAAYVQDDWKVRHNLTLNLGIRYSIDTPRHEAAGDISSFDPNEPNPAANGLPGALHYGGVGAGRDGNKNEQFADTYFKNIEPRIGFAFAPGWLHDTVVVRGAYTIMSGPLIYADYGQGLSAGFTTSTPAQTNDPFTYSGLLDAGPPTLSLSPIIDPAYNIGGTVDYVAKADGRPSSVQNFTLETQTQLAPDLILTIGYLGERGTHLRSLVYWENSLNPAYFGLGNTLYQPVQSAAGTAAGITAPFANFYNVTNGQVGQALLPHPQYGYINNDSYLQNRGQSTYNAMEVKLDRKFRNGLNLLGSYTFSKTFTDADSVQPYFATVLAQSGTQNPYNLKAERSVSEQDVPSNIVVSYLYELPVGKGKHFLGGSSRLVDALVGGYRLGGVARYVSGQPIGFYGAQGIPYFDGGIRFSRNVGTSLLTPAAASGHYNVFSFQQNTNTNNANPTAFWNRNAFIDVNDAVHRGAGPYNFGNMPRNDAEVRTGFYSNEDMNLNKHFAIHKEIAADLRWEVFNVFNRHVFNKPDSGVNDTNFGQIGGLIDSPRSMQLVLKIRY